MKEKSRMAVFFSLVVLGIFLLGCISLPPGGKVQAKETPRFSSCSAISAAFQESRQAMSGPLYYGMGMRTMAGAMTKESAADYGTQYSTTNIQVEGVDEADIVKTDGKFIYSLSNGKLAITDAFPAENAEVLSVTELENFTPQEMFIEGNKLVLFGYSYEKIYNEPMQKETISSKTVAPREPYYYRSTNVTTVKVFDASDKGKPKEIKAYEFEGQYVSSRKIGSNVYFVVRSYPEPMYRAMETQEGSNGMKGEGTEKVVPKFRETKEGIKEDFEPIARCTEIGYLPPVKAQAFITIASIDLSDLSKEIEKETVVGSGQNVFASQKNLYLAETSYRYYARTLPGIPVPIDQGSTEKTTVHKFSLNKGKIGYLGSMEAKGRILNQFSMDDFDVRLGIATTIGHVSRMGKSTSTNNIYVFGEDLKLKGKLEGLAPGEKIYSARFIGKRGYLVTFKKVDPLFVIDLSDPENLKVLGKLKIPGYSDYLHPFDETHLIGVGKQTEEAEEGDFAWYQGIKIAIFDVSDVENPIELHKTIIGDRGTDSYALHDHKAFLFDREKELLVVPILLAELSEGQKASKSSGWTQGEFVFQGAYVYNLSLENGFELKGRISHADEETFKKAGYYYYGGGDAVKRALYINEVLYTVSENKILANALSDLALIKELVLE